MKRISMIAVGVVTVWTAFLAVAVVEEAPAAVVQRLDARFKSDLASTRVNPRTASLWMRFNVTADPIGSLSPLRRLTISAGRGFRVELRRGTRCLAAAFVRLGSAACPSETKIGGGVAAADVTPLSVPVEGAVKMFNGVTTAGTPTILLALEPDIGPPVAIVGSVQNHATGPVGFEVSFDIPAFQTLPGVRDAAPIFFEFRTKKIVRVPTVCSGAWNVNGKFAYSSGEVAQSIAATPCRVARRR